MFKTFTFAFLFLGIQANAQVKNQDISFGQANEEIKAILGDGFEGTNAYGKCKLWVVYRADNINIYIRDFQNFDYKLNIYRRTDGLVTKRTTNMSTYYGAKVDGEFSILAPPLQVIPQKDGGVYISLELGRMGRPACGRVGPRK